MDGADGESKGSNKEPEAQKDANKKEKITLNTLYLAGIERGLTKPDMQRMTVGQLVDYVQEWNKRNEKAEHEEVEQSKPKKKYRLATPKETSEYHRG